MRAPPPRCLPRTRTEDIVAFCRAIAALVTAVQLQGTPPVPALDSARLIADLSALSADSMEGRRIATPGGARARAYLLRAFTRIGLAPVRDSFPAPFVAKTRAAELIGVNLVGMIRGTKHADRYLVVSAHYDHLGVRERRHLQRRRRQCLRHRRRARDGAVVQVAPAGELDHLRALRRRRSPACSARRHSWKRRRCRSSASSRT